MTTTKKDGNKESTDRDNYTGPVVPEDKALTLFLNRLWERGEPPERIELYQMFGRNSAQRGERIFVEHLKPNEKLNIENVTKLSNDIIEAAQNDVDSMPRPPRGGMAYQIAIINKHNSAASPLCRRLGPLVPKRAYALARPGDGDDDDLDDEDARDIKSLELAHIKESFDQVRWNQARYDKVMGELFMVSSDIASELRQHNALLFNQNMEMSKQLIELQDHALDRELVREREKFKLDMYRDGLRTARNMLPGIFGGANGANGASGTNGAANSEPKKTLSAAVEQQDPVAATYGSSPERTLVDNFLSDVEKDEPLNVALFGDFEEKDNGFAQVKPGIFALKQYALLLKVRDGVISPDELDVLMPNSGDPLAITQEQIELAMKAGVTEGIGSALFELMGLRQRKRQQQEEQNEETEDQPEQTE